MEQLLHLLFLIVLMITGLMWVMRMLIPKSTRTAIEHAIWHRIICGSSSNALSFTKLGKYLLVIIGLLYLASRF